MIHPALLALATAALAGCHGAAIVSRADGGVGADGSVVSTTRALRGSIGARLAGAAVSRVHVINARSGRTVASAVPNAQGQFTLNNVPRGGTYRMTAQAGQQAVPLVFPKQQGNAAAKTNLFNIGTRTNPRVGTTDGPIDLGDLGAVMEGGEVQVTPMNPANAPNMQEDFDEDGTPDGADPDVDGDGTPNAMDADNDGDGTADNTEFGDQDGDGITNESDPDMDGDGMPNELDADNDNDGTPDAMDASPNGDTRGTAEDTDGDGIPNTEDTTDPDDGEVIEDVDGGVPEDGGAACHDEPATAFHPSGAHWTYMDQAEWAAVTVDGGMPFAMCGGMQQTPVNIVTEGLAAEANPLAFHNYGAVPLRIVNNGHTVQVNVSGPFTETSPHVTFAGTRYYLAQFHGHTVSEHQVDGQNAAMEWHFVHSTNGLTDGTGNLLVVGVLFDAPAEGAAHPALQTLLTNGPAPEFEQTLCGVTVDLGALLPSNGSFYHYSPGSLTTPPCTMGLSWFVMRNRLTTSPAQVGAFLTAFGGHENNRAVQPLNGRAVTLYTAP